MEKPVYDRILVSEQQVRSAVEGLARQIESACAGAGPLLVLVVLEGARQFAHDLLRHLHAEVEVKYIRASSYHGGTQSSGQVDVEDLETVAARAAGRPILLIDDIYDTGLTLSTILGRLRQAGAADVKTCVLLHKKTAPRRPVAVDFVGLEIEDAFVIGYGLDYRGRYRDLPFIAVLADEFIES